MSPILPAAGSAAAPAKPDRATLKAAAKQFEAVFLRQMIGSMRSAKLAEDELMGSTASDQFRDMADARTADSMADQGGFGIATLLLRQFESQGSGVVAPAKPDVKPAGATAVKEDR